MLAVGILRGEKGFHSFEIPRPKIAQDDEILVKVMEVGIDGTDFNMVKYNLQDIADTRQNMVMGHEMVGVVEEVGVGVKTLAPGDVVVLTVRRGCGICQPCLHNQSDMCMTGLYTERGIHKKDGYLTEFVVDQEQYAAKVLGGLQELAIFTEPLSIAEKGIEQILIIQSRLPWACPHPGHGFKSKKWGGCRTALVVGAGPLGLLATALLRLSDVFTYTADIVPEDSIKAHLLKDMGAHYMDVRKKTPKEMVNLCCSANGTLDIIFEAAGAASTALELINYMSRSSIYIMTGIPRAGVPMKVDAAQLVSQIVRQNQVIVGSVNSNRNHFEMALKHLPEIKDFSGNMLSEMITHRFPLVDYEKAFAVTDERHIKTIIEVSP
jgi:threonine dehydrogenase-like Zn-dependent dehydrogenase